MITLDISSEKEISNIFCVNCGNKLQEFSNEELKEKIINADSIKEEFNVNKISSSFVNKLRKDRVNLIKSNKLECPSCKELIKIRIIKE